MSAVRGPAAVGAAPPPDRRAQLRRAAHELEGVFYNQLFQAMRASLPQDGLLDGASGQELFTALLDERLADEAAARTRNGIGEALYRQLARNLPPGPAEADAEGRP